MQQVTPEQVKAVVAHKGMERIEHHKCSMCGYQTAYIMFPSGAVGFDPGCYCTDGNLRNSSFDAIADTFNMQTPEIRARMWEDFQAGKPLID